MFRFGEKGEEDRVDSVTFDGSRTAPKSINGNENCLGSVGYFGRVIAIKFTAISTIPVHYLSNRYFIVRINILKCVMGLGLLRRI